MRILHKEHKKQQIQTIRGIILGRWAIIIGLTLVGVLHQIGDVAIISLSAKMLFYLIIVPTVYNIGYTIYLRARADKVSDRTLRIITFGQMVIDQLMITAIVYMTGGIESISYVLYFLPLLAATVLYREVEIMLFSLLTVVLYGALILLEFKNYLPHLARYNFDPGFIGNAELSLANTVSIVLIILTTGMFLVFINRIIYNRELQIMAERDKIRSILNSLEDGIIMLNPRRQILLINPPARDFLRLPAGFRSSFFDKKDFPKMFHQLIEVIEEQTKNKRLGQEVILVEKDNTNYIQVDSIPIKANDGTVLSWIKVLRDVTREKELDEIKSDFISIAAHQLRTPLSALKWFFKMMLDGDAGKITKQQKSMLGQAYERNNQVIEIVNNLLNISEIEEGRFPYEFAEGDMGDVIEKVIEDAAIDAKQKKVSLVFNEPAQALPLIEMDVQKMRMAIQNLVDNAVKYSHPNTTVKISTALKDNRYLVTIQDQGIGIPKEEQPKIFSKFFRGRLAKEQETTGSGLGMYIVRNIVQKHRGLIWFESQVGKGTAFFLSFPVSSKYLKNHKI